MGSCQCSSKNKDRVRKPRRTIYEQIDSIRGQIKREEYYSKNSRVEDHIDDSEEYYEEDVVNQQQSNQFVNSPDDSDDSGIQRERKPIIITKAQKASQDKTMDRTMERKPRRSFKSQTVQGIRWERGPQIGEGTYGKVYQGLNLNNGKLIAIKSVQIGSRKTASRELMALKYEVSILRDLDHPHIVKYIYTDADPAQKRVDILLEYVPGGSLSSLIKRFGGFNEKVTKIYLRQMIDAISYIHSKDIVHRDLKCANILINNDASIRVSDFGASKKLVKKEGSSDYEMCKSLKGSPYWLAPEVALREGHDTSADIWSLGCCAIEMLTGSPPWSDRSRKATKVLSFIKNPKDKITVPQNFSEECYDFIFNCCLQRDPSKRWTAEELIHHPYLKHSPESEELNTQVVENKESISSSNKQLVNPDDIKVEIDDENELNSNQNENVLRSSKAEERCGAAVPIPTVNAENSKPGEVGNAEENEGPYKTSNFSRWSDTQFEDGTCSFSFLKLCKNEEEKSKMKEDERNNILKGLKLCVKKNSDENTKNKANENPFSVSKAEVAS